MSLDVTRSAEPELVKTIRAVTEAVAETRRRVSDGEEVPIDQVLGQLQQWLAQCLRSTMPRSDGLRSALLALVDELEQLAVSAAEEHRRIGEVLGTMAGARRASTAYLAPGRRA